MRIERALVLALGLWALPAAGETPLSAIDWLSDSVTTPVAAPTAPPPLAEAPVTEGAIPEEIIVTPLDEVNADAVGLLPSSATGLPRDLWGASPSGVLAERLKRLDTGLLPAMQELLYTLLLAELTPPSDSSSKAVLFLARVDALLALGAVEQAKALLDRAGPDTPELFRRWFDASLLLGTEDEGCIKLKSAPDLAPTLTARIFCLARSGDWNAAAVTLETGRALGTLTGAEDALLVRFLDPEIFEGAPPLPPPARPSPLIYRLYEAIGEPLPTTTLPLAFAHADLRPITGWKAQVEAAERLARSGAMSENRLLGLYTERRAAASGGVWDRVAAVQAFDMALASGEPGAVAETLLPAWQAMGRVGLEVPFARLYADRLQAVPLAGEAGALAYRVALLSKGYERAARGRRPETPEERFLNAVARGDLGGIPAPDALSQAIVDGFAAPGPPARLMGFVDTGLLGEALLTAVQMMTEGARGDLDGLSDALALFRAVGLEDIARRAALQTLILDQRG